MKTLYVLRHGQAAAETDTESDHARELTLRGAAEVKRTARHLLERGNLPSLVLASSAARAQGTAKLCLAEWSAPPQLAISDDLYLAGPSSYLAALATHGGPHAVAMVVGHNPGLEALVYVLTERSEHLATASLVEIELPIAAFSELSDKGRSFARVVSVFRG